MLRFRLRTHDGHYVCAEGGGGRELVANRSTGAKWEAFRVVDLDGDALVNGNRIALVADDGHFVCAEGGGGRELVANRSAIGDWEKLTVVDVSGSGIKNGSRIALKTQSGMYICAEGGGGRELVANRTALGDWEKFTVELSTEQRALVVLQENSGRIPLPNGIPDPLRSGIFAVIDRLAETFENIKSQLQGAGKYDVVQLLTDADCTRSKLLDALVQHTKSGRTIDLVILTHGADNSLALHGESLGSSGVRSLLPDARARGCDNLRLWAVYSCSCYGSTLNDDWLQIGAKVAAGSLRNDWMPEPMTTFFIHRWLGGQTARDAAEAAYRDSIPLYTGIYPPTPQPRFRSETVSYPCGVEVDPARPWKTRVKMCTKTVQVLDGVDLIQSSKIDDTRLIVSGEAQLRF